MTPEARFFLPSGTVLIVVLAALSVSILYGPLTRGETVPIVLMLAGGACCSLAIILMVYFARRIGGRDQPF
jgi:hypothetical protein